MIQREHIIYSDSSKEKFSSNLKKNIKNHGETNDIKGFVSFRVKRKIFE